MTSKAESAQQMAKLHDGLSTLSRDDLRAFINEASADRVAMLDRGETREAATVDQWLFEMMDEVMRRRFKARKALMEGE